jgi:hypothetical protein
MPSISDFAWTYPLYFTLNTMAWARKMNKCHRRNHVDMIRTSVTDTSTSNRAIHMLVSCVARMFAMEPPRQA